MGFSYTTQICVLHDASHLIINLTIPIDIHFAQKTRLAMRFFYICHEQAVTGRVIFDLG